MIYNVESHGTSIEFTQDWKQAESAYRDCGNDCKIIAVQSSGAAQIVASKVARHSFSNSRLSK